MALWVIVVALLIASMIVAAVGFQKNSAVLLVAAGAWAVSFVVCAFAVKPDPVFVMFGLPLIGAYGVTILVLGLKALFK